MGDVRIGGTPGRKSHARHRILYFTRGVTSHDQRFAEAIAEQFELVYLRLHDGPLDVSVLPASARLLRWPVRAEAEDVLRSPTLPGQLSTMLRDIAPSLVHAGPVTTLAALVARAGFRPLVAMSWGSDLLRDIDSSQDAYEAARVALGGSNYVLVDTLAGAAAAQRVAGVPPQRVVRFPYGIDAAAFEEMAEPTFRTELGWRGAWVVGCNRWWEPQYGIIAMLEGFRLLAADEPTARLLLVGDGSLRPDVERFVSQHGLSARVHLAGALFGRRIKEALASMDVYVNPSLSDGTSVSQLEAMATGLLVVAADTAGNREWIENQTTGILVPPGDAAALADGLRWSMRLGPVERQVIADANRARVRARADWPAGVRELHRTYRAALRASRSEASA